MEINSTSLVEDPRLENLEVSESIESINKEASEKPENTSGFSSRWAFWLTAIGCSVGFGNVWRFPYLCYRHGGGSFLLVYVIVLFVVGVPITMVEFGVGQICQGSVVKTFTSLNRRYRGLAFSNWALWVIIIYYPILLAWSCLYIIGSCKKDLPWMPSKETISSCATLTGDACIGKCKINQDGECIANILTSAADFFNKSLNTGDVTEEGSFISWAAFGCAVFAWVCIVLFSTGGSKLMGYLNYVLTTVPALIILTLVGVGSSLEGASIGIKAYVGKIDFKAFTNPEIITDALSQALFSLSAAQGCMIAMGSFNPRSQNFVLDTYVVVLGDTLFAFLAGFSVFSVIGYLSVVTNTELDALKIGGPKLAFISYPLGIGASNIPYPWKQILLFFFFLTLFLIGMSTIIALVNTVLLPIEQSAFFLKKKIKRNYLMLGVSLYFFLWSVLLCTNIGVTFLDALDEANAVFGILFCCTIETVIIGWLTATEITVEKIGFRPTIFHGVSFFLGSVVSGITMFSIGSWVGLLVGLTLFMLIAIGGYILSIYFIEDKSQSLSEKMYNLSLLNIFKVRNWLNRHSCVNTKARVPRAVMIAIKYVIPFLVIHLMLQKTIASNAIFGSGKPIAIQVVSLFLTLTTPAGCVIFIIKPSWFWLLESNDEYTIVYDESSNVDDDYTSVYQKDEQDIEMI